jgi:hypothetical protein
VALGDSGKQSTMKGEGKTSPDFFNYKELELNLFVREIFFRRLRHSSEELAEELTDVLVERIKSHDFHKDRTVNNQ